MAGEGKTSPKERSSPGVARFCLKQHVFFFLIVVFVVFLDYFLLALIQFNGIL